MSWMYSKPFSNSCVASCTFLATETWYSSAPKFTSCVYCSVCLRSLCPSDALTCSRSFVLAYSIVA